jgi:hypothetical protein
MADTKAEQSEESSNESQGASRRGSTSRSNSDPMKRTAGTPEGAKAVKTADDLPLSVGPRDALIIDGHNEGDYVPDADGKGYHVGLVRQPVMALVKGGQIVGFEAVQESKFDAPGSLESLKAYHNEQEADWKEGRNYRLASPEPAANGASK